MSDKLPRLSLYTHDPKNPPGPDIEYVPNVKDIERIGAFNRHLAKAKAWSSRDGENKK